MKHSVIIPAHNAAHYLAECMQSVLTQLDAGDEVIIVDDGSSDGTLEIAKGFADRRIVVVAHDCRKGAGAARNTGMAKAAGEVIHFLDADDLWPPGRMDAVRAALVQHPEGSLFTGVVVHFHCPAFPPPRRDALPLPQVAALPGSLFVRHRLMEAAGPLDTSLTSGEFIEYVARLRRSGAEEVKCEAVLLHRRIHAANHSRADQNRGAAYLEVVRRQLRARTAP